jgi:RHS repeat-associated protein
MGQTRFESRGSSPRTDATQYAGTVTVSSGGASPHYFPHTGKELDEETGLYYYGARYLDPQTSRWLSTDPAMGEYIPQAPVDEEARQRNGNLPGMGGVFNTINLHVYHYAGNNPVRYINPDGRSEELAGIARALIENPAFVATTQNPSRAVEKIFNAAGFVRDSGGVYHTRQDALQGLGGYNKFYDLIFDACTSMKAYLFDFSHEDQYLAFWVWKGDYLNLGAGAELGIYKNLTISGSSTPHWLVDTNLALPMSMTLTDKNGNLIASYNPSENQWWITSFNPFRQNVKAGDLRASFTVDFSGKRDMYNSFYNEYKEDPRWVFNQNDYTATLNF